MKIIEKAARGLRSLARVASELADRARNDEAKAAELAALQAKRGALVEAGDLDGLEALDARIRRINLEVEVSTAARAKLAAEQAALQAEHDRAQREAEVRELHASGMRAREEAARLYAEEYPRLAGELRDLLNRTAELGRIIADANAALPPGAGRVPLDFEPSRGRPEEPRRMEMRQRTVYFNTATGEKLYGVSPGMAHVGSRVEEVEVETFPVAPTPHVRIHDLVSLPNLRYGEAEYWKPSPIHLAGPAVTDWRQLTHSEADTAAAFAGSMASRR